MKGSFTAGLKGFCYNAWNVLIRFERKISLQKKFQILRSALQHAFKSELTKSIVRTYTIVNKPPHDELISAISTWNAKSGREIRCSIELISWDAENGLLVLRITPKETNKTTNG